jgi:hypothetical protein
MFRKYKAGYMTNNTIKYNKTIKSKTPIIAEFITNENETIKIKNKKEGIVMKSKEQKNYKFTRDE